MKKVSFFLVILFSFSILNAQNSVNLFISNNYTQNNVVMDFSHYIKNHEFSVGVKYMLKPEKVPSSVLRHHYYPNDIVESIGIDANYSYWFFNVKKFSASIFYNFQFTSSSIVFDDMDIIGKAKAFENNIGIGLNYEILSPLSIQVQVGGGIIKDLLPQNIFADNWDYCYMIRVGAKYKF